MSKRRYIAAGWLSAMAVAGILGACGDDDDKVTATPTEAGTGDTGPGTKDATPDTYKPPTDGGPDADAAPWVYQATVLSTFDTALKENPNGITLIPGPAGEYGTPVVSMINIGKAAAVYPDGGHPVLASVTPWNPVARMTSVTYEPVNGLVGLVTTFGAPGAAVPPIGYYRLPMDGGLGTLLTDAGDPNFQFPNCVWWKPGTNGAYYGSDSNGWIVKVTADGVVTRWVQDPSLVGDKNACPGAALPTPRSFGANGLGVDANNVYVSNFDYGAVVRIPIQADGSAGTPVVMLQGLLNGGTDCTYQTADGIAVDTDGSVFLNVSTKNKIYKISPTAGTAPQLILQGKPPLDQPGDMLIESIKGKKKRLIFTNFAQNSTTADASPLAQLLSVDLPPDP